MKNVTAAERLAQEDFVTALLEFSESVFSGAQFVDSRANVTAQHIIRPIGVVRVYAKEVPS